MSDLRIIDDPAQYTAHRWSRGGAKVDYLIVHDPATDNARPEAIFRALQHNARQVSYNELLWSAEDGPESHVLSLPTEYVGHAGVATQIPGTGVRNGAVNRRTWGISVCTYGGKPGRELWWGLVDLVVYRIRQFGLPDAGVVLLHREISTTPGRRTDPRGVDGNDLRHDVETMLRTRGA